MLAGGDDDEDEDDASDLGDDASDEEDDDLGLDEDEDEGEDEEDDSDLSDDSSDKEDELADEPDEAAAESTGQSDDEDDGLPAGLDDDGPPTTALAPRPVAPPPKSAPVAARPAPAAMHEEVTAAQPDSGKPMAQAMTEDLKTTLAEALATTAYGAAGSPPLLDFASLIEPIPGDDPAGEGIPFAVREQLEEARKEVNPDSFRPDDPMRPEEPVKANWPRIIEVATDALQVHAKNLLVAARLTEAMTKRHGFAGLRDGLLLMRLLVAICWDRLEPALDEEDDMEVRAAPFNWLDDPDRGAYFPNTIRATPLVEGNGSSLGLLQWSQAQSGKGPIGPDTIEKTVMGATRQSCQTMADDVRQASLELRELYNALRARMGGEAPGLGAMRSAVEEARQLADQILQRKGSGDEGAADGESAGGENGAGEGGLQGGGRLNSRDAVYRQLAEAASALSRLEPHSPVPFLIQRAVALGALPFPQLMQELIRDSNVLLEMNRELGIKPPSDSH
jgi:type VI secretion system protein ImpA